MRARVAPAVSARCRPASSSRAARAAVAMQARKPASHSAPTRSARRWWSCVGTDQKDRGDVAAEAVLPPQAGGEEQAIHGARISVTLPVDPVPGAASGPDQRRTLIAPARRGQPIVDRRTSAVTGQPRESHGRDGAPGAVFGEPPPNRPGAFQQLTGTEPAQNPPNRGPVAKVGLAENEPVGAKWRPRSHTYREGNQDPAVGAEPGLHRVSSVFCA